MLADILCNFAEDELRSFIPSDAINFAFSFHEEDSSISKYDLAKLIALTKGPDFIFNKKSRRLLIERIPPYLLLKVFPEFSVLNEHQINAQHYGLISEWADAHPEQFAEKIGMLKVYQEFSEQSKAIKGISRITPGYSLYPYQQRISDTVINNLSNGIQRQLIHLPTGAGKTRTAMNIACMHLRQDPNNLVLWLADREELCTQAFHEFEKAWQALGVRSTSLYAFYSDADESLGGIDSGFVVAGLHKFLNIRKKDSRQVNLLYSALQSNVTLVIFDEAHKAIAPEFRKVIEDFISADGYNAYLLGLTATPGRKFLPEGLSDEDEKLSSFFDQNKVSMEVSGYLSPIDYLVEKQYLAKATFLSLNYEHSKILAYQIKGADESQTLNALAENKERNKRIIRVIKEECDIGSSIIVFACSVEHAVNITTALSFMGIKAASIDSKNDSPQSRRAKISQYKHGEVQVLVNFNVLTAGFDAPKTNVAVIAKPMDSLVQYLQMAGRAMRGFKSGGNHTCRIYTVMDEIPQFKNVNIAFEYWNEMWREG